MFNIPYDKIVEISTTTFSSFNLANCKWLLNRYCNYSCSYCWPHAHTNKKDFLNEDIYLLAIDNIVNQFEKSGFNNINWGWAGGEVTFNPSFLNILNEIQSYKVEKKKMFTNLVTNLSHKEKWWQRFIDSTKDFYSVKINASWHEEYLNTQMKREDFRSKLVFLKSNNIKVEVNVVLLPNKLSEIKKLQDWFLEKDIHMTVKVCKVGNEIMPGYSKEEMQFLKTQTKHRKFVLLRDENNNIYELSNFEQLMSQNLRSYLNWNCTAGHQAITIHEDGRVTRGQVCNQELLGNIKTGFKLFNKIKKCETKRNCSCSADLKMPKWKDNANNMLKVG